MEWGARGRVECEGESKVRGGGCSLGGESGVGCKSERERVWCEGERVRCGREAAV